jgi:hypothetical protein
MIKLKIFSVVLLIAISTTGKGFQLLKSFSVESISAVRNYTSVSKTNNITNHQKYGFLIDDQHSWIKCKVCHDKSSKNTGFNACVLCHLIKHQGLSGAKRNCKKCHGKNKVKRARYNHGTSWLNSIPHLSANCFMCHKTNIKKIPKECFSCHKKKSKHFPGDCSNCHKTSGWLVKFNHPPGFRNGAHAYLKCDSCHGPRGFKIKASCTTCHDKPANHPPGNCLKCHDMYGWKKANLSHRLGFLTGAHASLSCNICHGSRGFKITATCTTCHNKPPNHPPGDCIKCHNITDWKKTTFIHPSSILEGAHTNLNCGACHNVHGYNISSSCASCHNKPANHFPGDCLKCHNRSTWKGAKVSHTAGVLWGAHAKLSCNSCHKARGYNISSSCASCHNKPANHFPGDCLKCHNRSNWSASFNHPRIGEHSYRSFPCAKCHPNGYSSHSCTCHGGGNGPSGEGGD